MENRKEQILAFNQESLVEDKSLKLKVYNYFYLILKSKGKINSIIISFFILLETIQLISYAFEEPHLESWKLSKNVIKYISIILGSVRISPLMKYVTFNDYLILLYCLLVIIFIFCVLILFQVLSNNSSTKQIKGIFCIRLILNILAIFLYIPLTELFLLPLHCKEGNRMWERFILFICCTRNNRCSVNIFFSFFFFEFLFLPFL